jgi:hypothetical protein
MKPESTFKRDTGTIINDLGDVIGDAFTPISTRLGKINEGLKHHVRKFIFDSSIKSHDDRVKTIGFIEKAHAMSEGDYRVFDLALKNRDVEKVAYLVEKYDMVKEYETMRGVLDKLYIDAQDVGLDMNYIEEYFPRRVRKGMVGEFIAYMRGQDSWSAIKLAMEKVDPDGKFTPEEQAAFVNSFLRGYRETVLNMSRSGNTKERTVDYITPDMNRFYDDGIQTLINYIGSVRHGIEERKFFGKSERDAKGTIGEYVLGLVESGEIKPQQEEEVRKLLKAVLAPKGPSAFVRWTRDLSYVYTMGSPISAITQIQDLAFSIYKNGYYRTAKSFLKSVSGNAILTKKDLGIHDVFEEFSDKTRSADAVRKVFRITGLSWLDNIGKQTYLDAAYSRIVAANTKNKKQMMKQLDVIFGDEAGQVSRDLDAGNMTENVKYLMFSELSDMQPISIAEMPVGYSQSGNLRVLYRKRRSKTCCARV